MESFVHDQGFEAPEIEELQPLFPGFVIEGFLAQGGMGALYVARQKSLDRPVAIKILPREFGADPQFRASFESEAKTMARLNHTNLICHFSHAGVDAIADNTCHFGVNLFFADNGLGEQAPTPLYFPADALQLTEIVKHTFWDGGLRFLFSVRSELPYILDDAGGRRHDPENGYRFEPGRNEVVREGSAGWVITPRDSCSTIRFCGYSMRR